MLNKQKRNMYCFVSHTWNPIRVNKENLNRILK